MKVFIWLNVLITIFLVSYSHAADPIIVQTDCFDATITYGISALNDEENIHWVKVDDLVVKCENVVLQFGSQTADSTEGFGSVVPTDTHNGHTVYYSERYIKFLVEVLHDNEVEFSTEYIDF